MSAFYKTKAVSAIPAANAQESAMMSATENDLSIGYAVNDSLSLGYSTADAENNGADEKWCLLIC